MEKYVSVLGSAVFRIVAKPYQKAWSDELLGSVSVTERGQARVLSEVLAKNSIPVKLITAVGKDFFGQTIINNCRNLGVDIAHSLILEAATSTEVIFEGEKRTKVSDHGTLRNLDMSFITDKLQVLNGSFMCCIDSDFDEDKLKDILYVITVPVFMAPDREKNADKLVKFVDRIHTIRVNKEEMEHMVGFSLDGENNFKAAIDLLVKAGTKNVFITCGRAGVWYGNDSEFGFVEASPAVVIGREGVGSIFNGAVVSALTAGKNLRECAEEGVKLSTAYISGEWK